MNNDDFDDVFGEAARSYHQPPDVPRDAMWDAISRARTADIIPITRVQQRQPARRWLYTVAGIAAVLVVGIFIGRESRAPGASSTTVATRTIPSAPRDSIERDSVTPATSSRQVASVSRGSASASSGSRVVSRNAPDAKALDVSGDDAAYRLAVVEHLTRTEVLLTGFRARSHSEPDAKEDKQFAALSTDLLASTRLLLSRHSNDPELTRLLQDLELVLMQLSQYAADGRKADLDAVNQSIEKRNVLPKLRATIPAGTSMTAGT